jgi:hypothetical protein
LDLLKYGVIATLMWRTSVSNRARSRKQAALLQRSVKMFFTMRMGVFPAR